MSAQQQHQQAQQAQQARHSEQGQAVQQAQKQRQSQQAQHPEQAEQPAASVAKPLNEYSDIMEIDDQADLHHTPAQRQTPESAGDTVPVTSQATTAAGSDQEAPDSSQDLGIAQNAQVFGQHAQHEQQAEQAEQAQQVQEQSQRAAGMFLSALLHPASPPWQQHS